MKKLLVILWLFMTGAAMAQAATLSWDANAVSDSVTKYTVYQAAAAAGPWTKLADVTGATTYALSALAPGTYYFTVSATNVWGESGKSNTVNTPPGLPALPKNLIIALTIAPDGTVSFKLMTVEDFLV